MTLLLAALGYGARAVYAIGCWWSPEREHLRLSAIILVVGTVVEALLYRVFKPWLPFEMYVALRALAKVHLVLFLAALVSVTRTSSLQVRRLGCYAACVPFVWVLVEWWNDVGPVKIASEFGVVAPACRMVGTTLVGMACIVEVQARFGRKHISLERSQTMVLTFVVTDWVQLLIGQLGHLGIETHYAVPGLFSATVFVCVGWFAIWTLPSERELISRAYRKEDAKRGEPE